MHITSRLDCHHVAVTTHILSFLDFTPSSFYNQELPIARAYYHRRSQPALRSYMHTLTEILTVMDLITIYATDSSTNPDQQHRNREEADHSEFILRETFHRIIEASTRYHNANTPVVRPHQFQEPLHDTQQEIMEQLYLATEDACDILNLYPRPPENDARKIIFSLTNSIEHILDCHDDEWPIQSGWTRQAHWTPAKSSQE